MIDIINKENCCGCTACASVCRHNAITMVPDGMGFLYPKVDVDRCVNCGLCDKVCAFNHNSYDTSLNMLQPVAYGARHRDIGEVASSRSGAAFIAISDFILDKAGVVYGAGYDEHFRVVHKRATTKLQRDEFKGSKYVQSDLTGIFRSVKDDLSSGLTVLFSGTPCQTAALNSFVGSKLRANLYLVDIVCHGVPAPYIWRDYIVYLEKKHKDKVSRVNFRDKEEYGWTAHLESFMFKKKMPSKQYYSLYTFLFYEHIMLRCSCGVCKYTNLNRPSDITLADFWGWEMTAPNLNADDKGLSLVLCNTEKGLQLFDDVKEQMITIQAELRNCLQPNLQNPSQLHLLSKTFEEDYIRNGFEYVIKKYGNVGWRYRMKLLVRKFRSLVKRMIKR